MAVEVSSVVSIPRNWQKYGEIYIGKNFSTHIVCELCYQNQNCPITFLRDCTFDDAWSFWNHLEKHHLLNNRQAIDNPKKISERRYEIANSGECSAISNFDHQTNHERGTAEIFRNELSSNFGCLSSENIITIDDTDDENDKSTAPTVPTANHISGAEELIDMEIVKEEYATNDFLNDSQSPENLLPIIFGEVNTIPISKNTVIENTEKKQLTPTLQNVIADLVDNNQRFYTDIPNSVDTYVPGIQTSGNDPSNRSKLEFSNRRDVLHQSNTDQGSFQNTNNPNYQTQSYDLRRRIVTQEPIAEHNVNKNAMNRRNYKQYKAEQGNQEKLVDFSTFENIQENPLNQLPKPFNSMGKLDLQIGKNFDISSNSIPLTLPQISEVRGAVPFSFNKECQRNDLGSKNVHEHNNTDELTSPAIIGSRRKSYFDRPLQCPKCKIRFKVESSRKRHLFYYHHNKYSSHQLMSCRFCDKQYKFKDTEQHKCFVAFLKKELSINDMRITKDV